MNKYREELNVSDGQKPERMKWCNCATPNEWDGDNTCRDCNNMIPEKIEAFYKSKLEQAEKEKKELCDLIKKLRQNPSECEESRTVALWIGRKDYRDLYDKLRQIEL